MRIRTLKHLSYISTTIFLASFFVGCTGAIEDTDAPGAQPTGGGPDDPGGGGQGGDHVGPPPDPEICVPGIPATSQIPRMLNRQYDSTVRDLLGITGVGAEGKPPSEMLINDFEGPITNVAWQFYQDAAEEIAKAVMSGPNRSKFINCDPATNGCLEQTIRTFGRKAFRRPLEEAEVARFLKLGQTTPPGTPEEIAQTTLVGFLISPSFIMLPELSTADPSGQGYQLSSYETATRLSYLLWGSIPDDALNEAADRDELRTKEQILAQAKRMIAVREKSGPLVTAFHRHWVQMNNDSAHWWDIDHDTTKYPLYSPDAKPTMRAEIDAFFEDVAFSGGSYKDLLLSNVAFVNKHNAPIYGLDPANFGTDLTRVELDASVRPGFLTRAGFLSSYSSFSSTSPILRGAFITVNLLGVDPGAPLPGAANATVDGDFKTQRQYVEELTKPAACVGCHSIINPPGYVMEGFDAIGKLQTVDPLGGAIDASVTTSTIDFGDGVVKEISSPLQLMQEIVQIPKARKLYAQAWISYAYGRAPNGNDKCLVDQLDTKLSESGYSILDLMADLTQSDSFHVRVAEKQ